MSRNLPSVASRYLAAIDCSIEPPILPPSVTRHDAAPPMSPPTRSWKEPPPPQLNSDSLSSGKSPLQSRSTGNSPSSSRRSRASKTPPRDAAVDSSCHSISLFGTRSSFFPATTGALLGRQQQQEQRPLAAVDHDTDESSLTKSSRSATPPLIEEDGTGEQQERPIEENWRSRLDGVAGYKRRKNDASWIKKKGSSRQIGKSPRSSPKLNELEAARHIGKSPRSSPTVNELGTSATTKVMMNLSSRPLQSSPESMTDVTGISTEIITNRAIDLHRKLRLEMDERHTGDRLGQRPQHEQGEDGARDLIRLSLRRPVSHAPPPQRPVEISSLLSDSTNDESFTGPAFPTGRLGHHVGMASEGTDHSFQDPSLTSSVGVELGVHAVSESSPALKRVFGPQKVEPLTHYVENGADSDSPHKLAHPPSPGDGNPFLVRYSARTSPPSERHELYSIGSPRSCGSSGGWTPVPLSSSGMISEDFVLDSTATPIGKDEVLIKPLFSADRVPSASRSPFTKLYRRERSFDSDKVGPPDIRRVTGTPTKTPTKAFERTKPTSHVVTDTLPESASPEVNRDKAVGNDNAAVETRPSPREILAYGRARRRVIRNRTEYLSPGEKKPDGGTNLEDAAEQSRYIAKSPEADAVAPRKLFSSKGVTSNVHSGVTYKDHSEEMDRNVEKKSNETPALSKEIINDPVRDKKPFSSREATSIVHSRWASKLKENEVTNRDNSERRDRNVGRNDIDNDRVSDKQLRSGEDRDALTSKAPPPASALSVRERINKFSPPKDATDYIPPWAAKLKGKQAINKKQQEGFDRDVSAGKDSPATRAVLDETDEDNHYEQHVRNPQHSEEVNDTSALKSSPPSSSVRDRIRALSEGKSEPARLTPINVKMIFDTTSPTKRGDGPSRDGSQPVTSTTVQSTGDDSQTNSGTASFFSLNRSPAGAMPLNAILSQETHPEDSSEEIQRATKNHNTSRNRLVLGAHLAATVDEVSPQDRYRWRSKKVDNATETDDSHEISDVRSLKSFFEASTAPSDEDGDDDDDRTVESIRSIFEPAPKKEEPSAVSKMRAMFEKQTRAATGEKFAGNNAVSEAFTKFQASGPRRSPTKSVEPSKFQSPFASSEHCVEVPASSAKQAVTKSAPSKLQSSSVFQPLFALETSEAASEDMRDRRKLGESAAFEKTSERAPNDPPIMSVSERIRSLNLKQSPQKQMDPGVGEDFDATDNSPALPSVSPQSVKKDMSSVKATATAAATISSQAWKRKKPSLVTSNASGKDRAAESKESSPFADGTAKDSLVKLSGRKGDSYPSLTDRTNVFAGNAEKMFESRIIQKSPVSGPKSFQRGGMEHFQPAPADHGNDLNVLDLSTRALYGRKEDTENAQREPKQTNHQRHADPAGGKGEEQDEIIADQLTHNAQQFHGGGEKEGSAREGVVVSKKPLKTESCRVSDAGTSGTGSEFDDGVTLDLSIAEISQLTNPTCLQSQAGGTDSDSGAPTDHTSAAGGQVGKGPSEASSSQISEAMLPLIARLRLSDDGSASIHSAKLVSNGPVDDLKWEPLTAVDETAKTTPTMEEQESAWSPDDINATFPVSSSHFDAAFAAGNNLWQPLQDDNWESSPSFTTDWTPPAIDPYEMPTSEARLSDATPIRRNTTSNPSTQGDSHSSSLIQIDAKGRPSSRRLRPSPERKLSPINGAFFGRTHPTRYEANQKEQGVVSETTPKKYASASTSPSQMTGRIDETFPRSSPRSHMQGLNSPTGLATPRSSPIRRLEGAATGQEAALRGSPPPTISGSSKHAILMSKLRSLKEARIRRNAVTGFNKNSIHPSERQSRRPPTGNARTSSTTSALAPFLRPSFGGPLQTRPPNTSQYRRPEHTGDDEYSTSTKSLDFGGHKFADSLEVD